MRKGRGQSNLASRGTEGAGPQLAAFRQGTGLYDLLVCSGTGTQLSSICFSLCSEASLPMASHLLPLHVPAIAQGNSSLPGEKDFTRSS